MAALLHIHEDVWKNNIVTFLQLTDLVRLDTSVVNRKDRPAFLQNIAGCNVHERVVLGKHQIKHIEWFSRHNIFPGEVEFTQAFDPSSCSSTEKFLSKVKDIKFSADSTNHDCTLDHCKEDVTHLSFNVSVVLTEESLLRCVELCPNLTSYTRYFLQNITPKFHLRVPRLCPRLTHFEASMEEDIEEMVQIFRGNSTLTSLVLYCDWVTAGSLSQIAEYLPQLERLSILCVGADTQDVEFEHFARSSGQLRCLHLTSIDGFYFADAACRSIAARLPQLQELTLCGAELITDEGVVAIANACTGLHKLNLEKCRNITDVSMRAIATKCRVLRTLRIGRCSSFSRGVFELFDTGVVIHIAPN